MDVTSQLNSFFSCFLDIIGDCFGILDSIKFNGISLLVFNICIFILGIVIPIIITVVKSRPNRDGHRSRSSKGGESNEG